jgi:hypothetical protein
MGCKGGKDRRLLAAEEHMVEVLRVFMVATQWSVETFSVRLGELASQGWKVRWVSQYGGSARGLSLINVNLSRLFLHSLHFPISSSFFIIVWYLMQCRRCLLQFLTDPLVYTDL